MDALYNVHVHVFHPLLYGFNNNNNNNNNNTLFGKFKHVHVHIPFDENTHCFIFIISEQECLWPSGWYT